MLFGLRLFALLLSPLALSSSPLDNQAALDLAGKPLDPFSSKTRVHVLLFVRTDCPITRRYAPEMDRLAREYARQSVDFWLVYPRSRRSPRQHHSQY